MHLKGLLLKGDYELTQTIINSEDESDLHKRLI